jgi:hypothetical protein
MTDSTTLTVPSGAPDKEVEALVDRRCRIRGWWNRTGPWDDAQDQRTPVGLALSGGGIRSATFSLGILQGLAKSPRDALSRIDILSTVSGGGYVGCFFRSLFVPSSLRGIACEGGPPGPTLAGEIADQYKLARAALASGAEAREIKWHQRDAAEPTSLRNPIWWLREHSRYLAPSGPTDYGFAVAYLARNWLAMVYLFVLACAAIATPLIIIEAAITPVLGLLPAAARTISPLAPLVPLVVAISGAFSVAYWATQAMSTNEPHAAKQRKNLVNAAVAIAGAALAAIIVVAAIIAVLSWCYPGTAEWHAVLGRGLIPLFGGGAAMCVVGSVVAIATSRSLRTRGAMLTAELRLTLTNSLATCGRWLLILTVLALIDTLGAKLAHWVSIPGHTYPLSAAIFPALAFLIKKLPDWFGGKGGGGGTIGSLIGRFATMIALVVGMLLYGLLAIGAVALVHHFAWVGHAWITPPRWPALLTVTALVWILAIVSGRASGFINLSSLHSLYSSRLIRAYLGASNVWRLALVEGKHPRPVTENDPSDYIQPQIYGETDLPAPIHIVNVTLNETIDPTSQIVSRDRKGDILSVEPGGIRIGADLVDWSRLTNDPPTAGRYHAESISLGQWIAISGAAASSAMGRMTNLGSAIAFTFANIRLGYWWWAPELCPDMKRTTGFRGAVAQHFGTFVYLANEMTCRYSRGYDRKYLTDGGHYENSGAYALIRRRVPLAIVSDNGADPAYEFEDLQTLVRQVRIDLGGETTILAGNELAIFLATLKIVDHSVFVDPAIDPAWKTSMTNADTAPFVLALRVVLGVETVHLLWIKPRMLPGMPADVVGYAATMQPFPQQPTGDQFFDEAQWESYRRLGEEAMRRLLAACPGLLA